MRFFLGAAAVILASIMGAVIGQLIGHFISGGDKNVALDFALGGIVAAAAFGLAVLTTIADRQRNWSIAIGGLAAAALESAALGWLIWSR